MSDQEYPIEQGLEIPEPRRTARGGRARYPFAHMKIGDSFFVPANGDEKRNINKNLSALGNHFGKRNGMKFKTRVVDGGIRVWRVALEEKQDDDAK